MTVQQKAMETRELILQLVQQLVDAPDQVQVRTEIQNTRVLVHVAVAAGDVGRMIGRYGRMARSLRTIVGMLGRTDGLFYELVLEEDR